MRVKIFEEPTSQELEMKLNNWLSADNVEIKDIKYSNFYSDAVVQEFSSRYSALVCYNEY